MGHLPYRLVLGNFIGSGVLFAIYSLIRASPFSLYFDGHVHPAPAFSVIYFTFENLIRFSQGRHYLARARTGRDASPVRQHHRAGHRAAAVFRRFGKGYSVLSNEANRALPHRLLQPAATKFMPSLYSCRWPMIGLR